MKIFYDKQIAKELLQSRIKNRKDLDCFKRQIAKKYKIPIPKNSDLLKIYHETAKNETKFQSIKNLLITRPVRSLSGVVNVSVLTKPYPCPGKCIFCPNQKNLPKSYLSDEPAVQRAVSNKFSPSKQVISRLQALKATGHPIDKVELRIIGGTWSYYPASYQYKFIAECFRACNEFQGKKFKCQNSNVKSNPNYKIQKEQKINEKAKSRIVGIAIETRPDFINLKEIKQMRELGITKVELGVQSIYNDVLELCQRGHNVEETIKATRLLKNAGLKVSYQMMPNLPGSNLKKDIAIFKEIFTDPNFKPDYLKIYPLALVKSTPLYKLFQQKKFKPYTEKELIKLLIEIKKLAPKWCRIERIIRDIPPKNIVEGGSKILNLRSLVEAEMKIKGLKCQCIRCREIKANYDPKEKVELFRENYIASGEKEIFLTFENPARSKLYALLRLRLAAAPEGQTRVRPSSDPDLSAVMRELHVFGLSAEISEASGTPDSARLAQHKGLGKKLIAEAEKIAKSNGYKYLAIISGIGVRPYYRKLGYKLEDTYMIKMLNVKC